eukprot:CAMPEP_0185730754 /NCGR_PEP_ID=MMETSP1171-20130828/10902_1 /TAXON_ID=374046 /ORGANISM="Helicotheca tamensis, Strain CCMP826" /LENGTH=470 /DNA_ID=CAMNT_0028399877 /DNA_START=95 /DNA_END=1507 /DNA_ORIENTATION=+
MAEHGFKVCVGNRSPSKVDLTVSRAKNEGDLPIVGAKSPEEFISNLSKPRKVIILVQAGKPVDMTIATLSALMEEGDCIIDGGNEWYPNSIRRSKELEPKGIMFVGMGISGGEEGARNGPSLMPGGPKEAYDLIAPIITKCAAQVSDGTCTGYLGPVGSGNYIKMVHNGIEYGDMQLIAEVYDVLKNIVKMSNMDMAKQFAKWNEGDLSSYLIEITAKILAKKDDVTGEGYVVDYVLDKTGSKGTGRWTVQEAAEQSVACPTLAAALDSRYISSKKEDRLKAAEVLKGPTDFPNVAKDQIIEDLEAALYAAKVCSYAQGLQLIKAASDAHDWGVDLSECARLWKGGCIIRAKLLDKIQAALGANSNLENLMVDPGFADELNSRQLSWRRISTLCIASGIPVPAICASLNYFDSYRRKTLPASLTQAQRDFFGGHTYERVDREGVFHTAWTDAHKDIGDITERTKGEDVQK